MNRMIIEQVKDFNLDHIFTCGQCFRWQKRPNGSYTGTAFNRVVNMEFIPEIAQSATEGKLVIHNCAQEDDENIWRQYLDLERDYGEIKKTLSENDPIMKTAIRSGEGIRILKQDLWETILSFLISQNNNIPRIKGCIEHLAEMFGEPIGEYEGQVFYCLPAPEVLARLTPEELAAVRLGYRAKYLIQTAKTVCEKGLPCNEEDLAELSGVGPKVANCILLFGMAKYDSFPVDVWMRRVMNQLYSIDEKDVNGMTTYAQDHFGLLGGIAQQYLFHHIREIQGHKGSSPMNG